MLIDVESILSRTHLAVLAFLFLGIYAAECQSLLVAAILPIFVAALAVAAFINGFWMCVQGYFIRAVNLPRFWYYWAHFIGEKGLKISPLQVALLTACLFSFSLARATDYETFAFAILVKNDFRGLVFSCEGTISENNCQCAFPSSLIAQGQCAISGEDVLKVCTLGCCATP